MRTEFLLAPVILLGTSDADLVPISAESKVVLRCEDTTSSGDAQAITTCQWGCYRRCLGGLTAMSDAGVKTMDIMITGNDLNSCVRELPDHCRLHGSTFSYTVLSKYCADIAKPASTGETETDATSELLYKIQIPRKYSDIGLYATTFAPTDTSIGLAGRVPTDVCLANSGFKVSAMSDLDYGSCNNLQSQDNSVAEQSLTFPFFSVNRLDIPLDNIASTLMNNQRGLQTTHNHLMITTATNCYVQKPDVIYLFSRGNFTMTTGAPTTCKVATILATALIFFTIW